MDVFNATAHALVFADLCAARWGLDAATCDRRWQRWLDLRSRQAAREEDLLRSKERRAAYDWQPSSLSSSSFSEEEKKDDVSVALGIVSARDHYAHREAARRTWLRHAHSVLTHHKFFVASTEEVEALQREIAAFNDVAVLPWTESYRATLRKVLAIFRWGVQSNADFVGRANDDVYLRLEETRHLLRASSQRRVWAGHFLEGMWPPQALAPVKAWGPVPSRSSEAAYPPFAQGNAYFLSRDLAFLLTEDDTHDLPDDVLAGIVIDAAGPFERVDVPTDYELEGAWTPCSDDALWHFNVHPEHFYDLHDLSVLDVDVDGKEVRLEFDDATDLRALARAFAADHAHLTGEGCTTADSFHCLAATLEDAALRLQKKRSLSPCDRIPDRLFCCG